MSTEEQSIENKSIQSITEFYENNRNNLLIAGVALLLIAGGIYYYNNFYKPAQNEEAADSFFTAERYYKLDSLNLALNGDGINYGMIDIADEFGSTKIGDQATYYAGRILLEQGKFEDALDYLGDVGMSDELMAAQVITLQGDCYSELEQFEEAGDAYMDAANKRENSLTSPYALYKAGIAYEAAGEFGDAISAFEKLEDYPDSRFSAKSEAYIAKLKAAKASQ